MFYAILTLSMITACCVIGLVVERWQARRVDKRIDERIAVLKTALKLSQDLDNSMNERAAQFREAHHV
jgi:hypothetical protein